MHKKLWWVLWYKIFFIIKLIIFYLNNHWSNCEIIGFMEVSNIETKASILSTLPISSTLQYLLRTLSVNSATVSLRHSASFCCSVCINSITYSRLSYTSKPLSLNILWNALHASAVNNFMLLYICSWKMCLHSNKYQLRNKQKQLREIKPSALLPFSILFIIAQASLTIRH